jgi:recombination protein RecR
VAERVSGPEIERLIQLLARLPGLGPRSARRAALHLIRKRDELLGPLADALQAAREKIVTCSVCGNVDTCDPCAVCRDDRRDRATLIVVETVADLWALERAAALRARYHVLGGTLSPLDGVGPKDLNLASLVDRVAGDEVKEVILAVNATVDGQTTAHYITDLLAHLNVKTTRLAHGVPVGGELDYLDEGTLAAAMRARTDF